MAQKETLEAVEGAVFLGVNNDGVLDDDLYEMYSLEIVAKHIYNAMRFEREASTPAWVPHGNSLAQDEARKTAGFVISFIAEMVRNETK